MLAKADTYSDVDRSHDGEAVRKTSGLFAFRVPDCRFAYSDAPQGKGRGHRGWVWLLVGFIL